MFVQSFVMRIVELCGIITALRSADAVLLLLLLVLIQKALLFEMQADASKRRVQKLASTIINNTTLFTIKEKGLCFLGLSGITLLRDRECVSLIECPLA